LLNQVYITLALDGRPDHATRSHPDLTGFPKPVRSQSHHNPFSRQRFSRQEKHKNHGSKNKKRRTQTMSVVDASLSDFFTNAAIQITNAQQQPEIAAALDTYGYDAAAIQEGQTLLTVARKLYDTQITEYGQQHAATQAFEDACRQIDKTYAAHRKLAKVAFKNDPLRQTDLRLNERKPKLYAPWHEQARHFYTNILADSEAQTQLARYKITFDALQTTLAQVDQAETLKAIQRQETSQAQDATDQRDAALLALDDWLDDFKAIARIALSDTPQLLESLNLGPIP